MRNKVEIRAFAIEQVVKMRCMSECPAKDLVSEAKMLEDYIIGKAKMEEFQDEHKMIKDILGFSKTNPIEAMGMCGAMKN